MYFGVIILYGQGPFANGGAVSKRESPLRPRMIGGVFLVQRPFQRIVLDVFPDAVEIVIVADDVIVE